MATVPKFIFGLLKDGLCGQEFMAINYNTEIIYNKLILISFHVLICNEWMKFTHYYSPEMNRSELLSILTCPSFPQLNVTTKIVVDIKTQNEERLLFLKYRLENAQMRFYVM